MFTPHETPSDPSPPGLPVTQARYSVATYHRTRCYGGPEEGGWYYDRDVPEMLDGDSGVHVALVQTRYFATETEAEAQCRLVNDHLNDTINRQRRDLGSVLSTGIYIADVRLGDPSHAPQETPRYE